MPKLFIFLVGFVLTGAIKRMIVGAGLALGTHVIIKTLFDKYIELTIEQSDSFLSATFGLLALAEIPMCISLIISATVARVVINSTTLALKKA